MCICIFALRCTHTCMQLWFMSTGNIYQISKKQGLQTVCPTSMLRIVSSAWQCWAMQVCAPQRPSLSLDREHFHTMLQSWPHTIIFSPVCYFERQPVKTLVYKWRGTVECHASVAAEEGKQLVPGGSMCTLKVKEGDSTERHICCQQCGCEILWNFHVCDLSRAWYTKQETLISD